MTALPTMLHFLVLAQLQCVSFFLSPISVVLFQSSAFQQPLYRLLNEVMFSNFGTVSPRSSEYYSPLLDTFYTVLLPFSIFLCRTPPPFRNFTTIRNSNWKAHQLLTPPPYTSKSVFALPFTASASLPITSRKRFILHSSLIHGPIRPVVFPTSISMVFVNQYNDKFCPTIVTSYYLHIFPWSKEDSKASKSILHEPSLIRQLKFHSISKPKGQNQSGALKCSWVSSDNT